MKINKNRRSKVTAKTNNPKTEVIEMPTQVQTVPLSRLMPHPDNPNRMSSTTFAKLVRNIERTGKYEPLIVRPCPQKDCDICPHNRNKGKGPCDPTAENKQQFYQVINGHHRAKALAKLGCKTAEVIVWEIDDEQADIYLTTLNRLAGSDMLAHKLAIIKRLNEKADARRLSKLLPQTQKQLNRLMGLRMPKAPAPSVTMPIPLIFFISRKQKLIIERALSLTGTDTMPGTSAERKSAALMRLAEVFLESLNTSKAGNNKSA